MDCWRGSNIGRAHLESASLGSKGLDAGWPDVRRIVMGQQAAHVQSGGNSGSGQGHRDSTTFRCDVDQRRSAEGDIGGSRTIPIVER